jgi:hypothetical protein
MKRHNQQQNQRGIRISSVEREMHEPNVIYPSRTSQHAEAATIAGLAIWRIIGLMAAATRPAVPASSSESQRSSLVVEPPPESQLFRFGLRQMLLFVAGAAALLGVMVTIGGGWGPAVGFLAALVAAHVLATSVGTRLRDSSPEVRQWRSQLPGADSDAPPLPGSMTPGELAALATSSLARRQDSPWRTWLPAAAGAISGGFLGAAAIPLIAGPQATTAGLALGAVSCAVICGWLTLLASNFVSIARGAWHEAHGKSAKRKRRGWFSGDNDTT